MNYFGLILLIQLIYSDNKWHFKLNVLFFFDIESYLGEYFFTVLKVLYLIDSLMSSILQFQRKIYINV